MTLKEQQLKLARRLKAAHDKYMKDSADLMPQNLDEYLVEFFIPIASYLAAVTCSAHDLACRVSGQQLDLSVTVEYVLNAYQRMLACNNERVH